MLPFKTPTVTMPVGGDTTQFQLAGLPIKGPKGGRLVITRLWVEVAVQVDTGVGVTIAEGGWANFVRRFFMRTPYGTVDLSGPQLRALAIREMGRRAPADPTALAASQNNATRTLKLCLDLNPRQAKRGKDFTIPVDVLKAEGDGAIQVSTNGAASIGSGGTPTVDSCTVTLRFECREEYDVVARCKRELKAISQANTTDLTLGIGGRAIRQMIAHKYADHITGSADLSAITAVNIPTFSYTDIPPSQLRDALISDGEHDAASTGDPFVQSTLRALALVTPHSGQKMGEFLSHSGDLAVNLVGNATANLPIIVDLLSPMDEASMAIELAYAQKAGLDIRTVKTADKTRKSRDAWDDFTARLLPNKFGKAA